MLILLALHLNASILLFCSFQVCEYLKRKPLGMQTLFDNVLSRALVIQSCLVWIFVILPLDISYFFKFPHWLAISVCIVIDFVTTIFSIYLNVIILVRYVSIYHSTLVEEQDEKKIENKIFRIAFVASAVLTLLENSLIMDPANFSFYKIATKQMDEIQQGSKLNLILLALSAIWAVLLQIKLEIANDEENKTEGRMRCILFLTSFVFIWIWMVGIKPKVSEFPIRVFLQVCLINYFLIKFIWSNENLKAFFVSRFPFPNPFVNVNE